MTTKWLLAILFLVSANHAIGSECRGSTGLEKAKMGETSAAFDELRGCENDPNASAAALFTLAWLYHVEGLGGLTSKERVLKSWALTEQAALTGDEDAVVTLASMFGAGSAELGLEPNPKIQDCLLAATTKSPKAGDEHDGKISKEAIEQCLILDSNRASISSSGLDN